MTVAVSHRRSRVLIVGRPSALQANHRPSKAPLIHRDSSIPGQSLLSPFPSLLPGDNSCKESPQDGRGGKKEAWAWEGVKTTVAKAVQRIREMVGGG